MEEIRGTIVDVEGPVASGAKWLVIDVNGEQKRFGADSRMLLRAIADGGFSRGDKIVAQVEDGILHSISFDE